MRLKIRKKARKSMLRKAMDWPKQGGYWIAVGAMAAYGATGGALVPGMYAQDVTKRNPSPVTESGQTLPVRRFDIPAGPLEDVVQAYRNATGMQVTFSNVAIGRIQSPGVRGLHTDQEALSRIVRSTGIDVRPQAGNSFELRPTSQTTRIEVIEDIAPLSSGKYTEPLRDTPQTINVISRNVIEQQGATSLRDVLRNVPGLTLTAGEGGGAPGDNINIRGFSSRNDIFVDGVRDISPQSRDPFNLEQVEVVKGPNSAFSGRGSAGGAVNMVSKQAGLRTIYGGSVLLGTDKTRRFTGDINTPVPFLGERTGFRMNGLYHNGGVAGRDEVKVERWGLAPTLTFGLGSPTRYTFGYYKLQQDNIGDYGVPWVPATNNVLVEYRDRPAPVPRETFYGLTDRDKEKSGVDSVTGRVEHDFSDLVRLQNQFRFSRNTQDFIASPPRFASVDSTDVNRELRSWLTNDKVIDNQTNLTAEFKTGGIRHSLVTGMSLTRENQTRWTRSGPGMRTTLLNPNPHDVYTGVITRGTTQGDIDGTTVGLYAFDTLHFGKYFEATGGARWERFDVNGITTAAASLARVDKMTGTRAGLVFKPVEATSIYASYGTALNPSLEGLTYSAASTDLPPERTYTYEIGNKWQVLSNRLLLSGAFFNVEKTNARTPGVNPGDPPTVLDGRQRNRGIELSATGFITPTLQILAGYTAMDPKIIESNTATEVGNQIQNAPKNSGNIWATYTLKKVTIGGGPRFVGKRYGNNSNARFVDSYWTMEALASYQVNRWLSLRANLYNLNDALYYDRLGGGHVIPGPSRSLLIGTNFTF